MARAWGNERFGDVAPWEEVCLGAEQHDVGHTAWEQVPRFNPQTGLPYSIFEMPRQWHIQLWSSAARLVLPQGRYAALLVSLHGSTWLYESYDAAADTHENAEAVLHYQTQERAFQQELFTNLRVDPHYGPFASEKAIARNGRLLWVWDVLSLAICFGGWQTQSLPKVPTATSATTLTLSAHDGDPTHLIVTPWPFRREQVKLVYEGRCLAETFSNVTMMREALKRAPWVTMKTTLFPDQSV